VVLGAVTLEDAFGAQEAFLTSTTRGVLPIVQLDGRLIGDGTVGPVTRELMAAWERVLLGE
jgi:branched-chain amino acid aminotransferase